MADAQIRITADTSQAERALGGLTRALGALGGIVVGGNLVEQFVKITSSAQEMTNKLIFATGSVEAANKTFGLLADTARRTGSDLGGTVDLYQKLAASATLTGSSTESLAYITEQFNKTLQISGASGAGAASALYQFAQAMQKGTLNGDEFRNMAETNGFMMKILADRITKGSIPALRQMATEGRLSAELISKALLESTEIAELHGKTVQTIPQAYENLNTSLTVAIKSFSDITGLGDAFVNILNFMSENIGVVIGAMAGLGVAALALAASLIPAATLMSLIFPIGAAAAVVAVGAALGYAAQQAGVFGEKSKAAGKSQAELQAAANAGAKITAQRTTEQENLDKALNKTIGKLRDETKILQQSTGLRDLRTETEKVITEERRKYLDIGKLIPMQLEKELRVATRKKIIEEDNLKVRRSILELESATATAGIKDQGQRQVTAQLESYRLGLTKQVYEANKANLAVKITENIQAEELNSYTQDLALAQLEINGLTIHDVALREEHLRIEKERLRLGSLFTEQMAETISKTVQAEQAARAQADITQELLKLEDERYGLTIADVKEREIALAIRAKERELGVALTQAAKDQLIASLNLTLAAKAQNNITQELLKLEDERYGLGIADLKQREISVAIRAKERELGSALTQDMKDQLVVSMQLTQAARDREQITQSLRAATQSLTGVEAGKAAAGQMGSLDPTLAAQRANETLFNGLEYLRSQDLISEQSYQNAKINAAVQAQEAIMSANKKQYESQALLRIQAQTGTKFGFEQQKAMAAEAARFEMLSTMEKTQFGIQQAAQLFGALGAQNKKAFEAAKAFNMANAIMNTYMAATKALAMYPPPFSFIAAAAAVAMGLAQVAQIRSQSYSGRALGGPVMGGKPYIVGESGPELFTPSTTGSITRNSDLQGGGVTNVNFTIVANDTTGFDQLLASRKGVIQQIISDAMLEKGRRSMV
jgi:tape measure domain-containing protein